MFGVIAKLTLRTIATECMLSVEVNENDISPSTLRSN